MRCASPIRPTRCASTSSSTARWRRTRISTRASSTWTSFEFDSSTRKKAASAAFFISTGGNMTLRVRTIAEFIGTFWLVLGGCGRAVLALGFPGISIGLLGVSVAFGLTVVTMAYAIGHISGCHLNPAVSVGLAAGGRFPAGDVLPYVIAQVIGAIIAAAVLYFIASGAPGFSLD